MIRHLSLPVDAGTCKVQSHEMKALDEDGNVILAQRGGEVTPEISLVPYCKVAQVNSLQVAEIKHPASNAQFASVHRDSVSIEPAPP